MFPEIRSRVKALLGFERKAGGEGVDWYARNGFRNLYDLHASGGPSWSGEITTDATANNLSTFWACRRIITEAAAFVPLEMMAKTSAGKFPAEDQSLYRLLKNAPNEEMSSMVYREAGVGNLLMGGMWYSQIFRRSGTGQVAEIQPLLPAQVKLDRDRENRRVFVVDPNLPGARAYTVIPGKPHDILNVTGPSLTGREGQGIVQQARQSLGAVTSAERYAASYYRRGGRQPGFIEMPPSRSVFKTTQEEDKFVEDLTRSMDGPENFHKWPMFPSGMKFQSWGWSPEDSQFMSARSYNVPEVCRWFLLSPDMVGDLSKATLNNMEQLMLRFYKLTLTAWLVRIEQDFWRCLLTPAEKASGKYYFRHNVNGLLRGDFLTRIQGYASMLQNGVYNIDDVLDFEDFNPLPNGAGQAHHIQLNMQTIPGTGEPTVAEAAALAKGLPVNAASGNEPAPAASGNADVDQLRAAVADLQDELAALKTAKKPKAA